MENHLKKKSVLPMIVLSGAPGVSGLIVLSLVEEEPGPEPGIVLLKQRMEKLIHHADLVCQFESGFDCLKCFI